VKAGGKQNNPPTTCFHAGFLAYFFDPADGGDMFLRNVLFITTAVSTSNLTRKKMPEQSIILRRLTILRNGKSFSGQKQLHNIWIIHYKLLLWQ
jgi:hypothetical protein